MTQAFLSACRASAESVEFEALEAALASACRAAKDAFPTVKLPPERFALWLGAHVQPTAPPLEGLSALRVADLYLVCASDEGDAFATAALAEQVRRLSQEICLRGRAAVDPDDLFLAVQERLFVRRSEGPSRLSTYAGQAPLETWLRAVCVRTLATLGRTAGREVTLEDRAQELLVGGGGDPEIAILRSKYEDQFKAAFREALQGLEPKDRNLLRLQLFEKLTLDELARVHGVHRATVARWLSRIRDVLLGRTRERLAQVLGLGPREVESLLGMLGSRLDVSLGPLKAIKDGDDD